MKQLRVHQKHYCQQRPLCWWARAPLAPFDCADVAGERLLWPPELLLATNLDSPSARVAAHAAGEPESAAGCMQIDGRTGVAGCFRSMDAGSSMDILNRMGTLHGTMHS